MKIRVFFRTRFIIGFVLIIALSGCTGQLEVPENTTKTITTTPITTTPITPPTDPPTDPPTNTTIANLTLIDAFVVYDGSYTKVVDEGVGYGKGSVFLSNTGTGKDEITDIEIFYAETFAGPWIAITNAVSLQSISIANPYEINPLATNEELTVRFPIPTENIDNSITYRMTVISKNGSILDTSISEVINEEDMLLTKDRPNLTPPSSIGTIRRIHTISPLSVSDNSEIKNITYDVSAVSDFSSIDRSIAITSPLWRWQWNTINSSTQGLDNGSYYLRMTVYDYAGLSNYTNALPLTIDNDYVRPRISNVVGSSVKNGQDIAEVGESFSITATITDSGSSVSNVGEAYIFYKLNDSSTIYSVTAMTKSSGDTWSGNIPAVFIDSEALANNLTYYIRANDEDNNEEQSSDYYADVNDSTEPNFISHIFEGVTIISQDPLIGNEGQTLSLSVSVEDRNYVSTVSLIWRERNDTGLSPQYGNWKVFSNITGSGDNWNFILPALNVTLDGLEYYFTAMDPANNIAYEGTPSSPYRILVADEVNPVISIVSTIPDSITEGTDLAVTVAIADNDKTFSWTGQETGTVELGYKKPGESVYTYSAMSHISGDSSIGETSIWTGTIIGGNFSIAATPVWIQVRSIDNAGKVSLIEKSIDVTISGTPLLVYVTGTGEVTGASDHFLGFDVKNNAGGATPATANITDIQVELLDNGKGVVTGTPVTTLIDASGTVWQNSSALEGANNSIITLDSPILLPKDSTISFTVTYANSSGGFYNLNDLTIKITLFYEFGVSSSDSEQLDSFNTPSTQSIPQTETRFLRSNVATVNGLTAYDLETSLTGSIGLGDQSSTVSGDESVTWGIRIYIRHSTGTETEITSEMVATVTRAAGGDAAGMQISSWVCPQTSLVSTDSIVIEVWYQIGASSPMIAAEFTTPRLGATQLDASTWSVSYYTERDRSGTFFDRQTAALFHWGDPAHNSRIDNFSYSTT
jgi:hypothetical protein